MTLKNVSEAKAELSALLVQVENGEEVVIARAGRPVAKLVKVEGLAQPRKLGALKGKIWISPDFDKPDAEIESLFFGRPVEPTP